MRGRLKARKNRAISVHQEKQLFKRTALAAAVVLATSPPGMALANGWGRNVEVFAVPSTKERVLLGAQVLQPLLQDAHSLTYLDVRAVYDPTDDINEFNFGLGYRQYYGSNWLLGGYAAFDTRETDRVSRHNNVTFGLEALSVPWDVNFNYYLPVSDEEVVGTGVSGGSFVGSSLFANGVVEEALEGFDFEVGALLPFISMGEARAYLGTYYFDADSVDVDTGLGIRGRIEYRPRKDIMLEVDVSDDDLFDTEAMFTVNFSFGMPRETGVRTLSERMIQFHERDIDIKETSPIDDSVMESTDPSNRVTVSGDVVHIDNALGTAGGDGTIENPYDTFATCIGQRCDSSGSLVYVHAGNSTTAAPYDTTTFTLANNQSVFGQGFSLFGIGGDQFSVVTAADDALRLRLGGNNEVAGLHIYGAGNNGIDGNNVGNFNIHDNRIENVGNQGIRITNDNGNTSTGFITNNSINTTGSHGIYLYNYAESPAVSTQVVTISNNSIKNAGRDGIRVRNVVDTDDGSASAIQSVVISNNTIYNSTNSGISVLNESDGCCGGVPSYNVVATQNVTIQNNVITESGRHGVYLYNQVDQSSGYATMRATQNVVLSNNTLNNNDQYGVKIVNDIIGDSYSGFGEGTQNITLNNNVIKGNGNGGVFIGNYIYSDDTEPGILRATQNVTLNSNVISNNTGDGIKIFQGYNSSSGYFNTISTQTVTLAGNTIQNNTDDGIDMYTQGAPDQDNYGGVSSQTLVLNPTNVISGNGDYAITVAYDFYDSTNTSHTQTVIINPGNTISGGIYIE